LKPLKLLTLLVLAFATLGASLSMAETPSTHNHLEPVLIKTTTPNQSLPDFSKYKDVKQKKTAFFNYLLPYINQSNSAILKQRRYIKSLNFNQLSDSDKANIQVLIKRYRFKYTDITPQTKKTLLKKVDVIPPSLALAQAANETAWGSSRFAKKALNFYGQWCFKQGCGLVPLRRPQGEYHEVKIFNTPLESVKSYMLMLNSHPAFKPLRDTRWQASAHNQPINGLLLAHGLKDYSARKEVYVNAIASMIRTNKLVKFDTFDKRP